MLQLNFKFLNNVNIFTDKQTERAKLDHYVCREQTNVIQNMIRKYATLRHCYI